MYKNHFPGIKRKIFVSLIIFSIIMLIVLWIFQVAFLEPFFKRVKLNSIIKEADKIKAILQQDTETAQINLKKYMEESKNKSNFYAELWYVYDGMVATDSYVTLNDLSTMRPYILQWNWQSIYETAKSNNGVYIEQIDGRDGKKRTSDSELDEATVVDTFLYAEVCPMGDILLPTDFNKKASWDIVIVISTNLTPLASTVETLTSQLRYGTFFVLLISASVSIIISGYVSYPIEQINKSAKELAKGNYSVHFEGGGYREIDELSETLNTAAIELSKVDKLQKELIANVSHDLRTPLTLISGYSEMMRDIPKEATAENFQIIIDETQRLTSLVNDLLDISKQQSQDVLSIKIFNLTDTIKRALKRFSKLTQKDGYEVNFNYTGEVFAYADESRILQVIYNLVTNALTYTGDDKIINVNQIVNGNKVKIEVVDTGKGIKESEIPNIWKKYYQAEETHVRAVTGTGLGLTIVKENLDIHENIEYGVESEQGKGSCFWFEMMVESFKENDNIVEKEKYNDDK